MRISDEAGQSPTQHQFGPYQIISSPQELVLRLERRGEIGVGGCLLFAAILVGVMTLGLLAVFQDVQQPPTTHQIDDAGRLFAPHQNHFGFIWLISCLLLLGLIPWYVTRAYRAAMTFTFRRQDDTFLRDGRLVTPLRKIEHLTITESRDPDGKYLYFLTLFYGDGRSLMLHDGYNEREIMNLANEIAAYVGTRIVWR